MAGVFNIIPKNGSTITCAFGDNESIPYNIVAADFNEAEREEVLYSGGKLGGSVVNINYGIVEITLLFAVGGTSENEAAINARTLSSALRNIDGGLIEYRPREYGSTVTNTFYRYLKAGASRRVSKKTLIPTETHIAGELHEFTVTTFAWATSDPNNFETIVSETRIYNHDDAGHNNYIDILGSDIKGDVFFPIIKFQGDYATVSYSNSLIVHKRPMRVGAHTNLDWIEGEDITGIGGTGSLASASNGSYVIVSSTPTTSSFQSFPAWDSTYLGNISMIIATRVPVGDNGVWKVEIRIADPTAITQRVNLNTSVWGDLGTAWSIFYQFNEFVMPPFNVQRHITDTSTPSISTYISEMGWYIYFERLSGTGNLWLDWVLFARADDWINVFNSTTIGNNAAIAHNGSKYLEVDALSSGVWLKEDTNDAVDALWESVGPPVSSLVFRSSEDSRLRFINVGNDGYPYDGLFESLVTITGVHATIYPFET